MSFFGKNIRKIRTLKNLSQQAFADLFDVKRANIGAYEEGRAQPKHELALKVANHFSVALEDLLGKDLTVNQLSKFDLLSRQERAVVSVQDAAANYMTAPVRASGSIPVVSPGRYASFIKDGLEALLETGAGLALPEAWAGAKAAFEVQGVEMDQGHAGLKPGDLVLAVPVSETEWKELPAGYVYVWMHDTSYRILRLARDGKKALLTPDNPTFAPVTLHLQKLKQVWRVIGILSRFAPQPPPATDRLAALEAKVEALLQRSKED